MGTRSLTYVYGGDRETKPLMCLYRQFDGYPAGHGQELIDFLKPIKLVNGLSLDNKQKVANGMGCLAAQLVAHFKDGPGQFYLYEPELNQDAWQDYEYHVRNIDGEFKITVFNCGVNFFGLTQSEQHDKIFEGNLSQFAEFCSAEELA